MNREDLPEDLKPIADQLIDVKETFGADGISIERIDGGWEVQLRYMTEEES